MSKVRPKKFLGQHFLKDISIAEDIVKSLAINVSNEPVLEIGPGMGVLTDILLENPAIQLKVIELDRESVAFLQKKYKDYNIEIINGDFLKTNLEHIFDGPFKIIGNFPYNISSQIFFKILDYPNQVTEIVCMLQKEVAMRLASPPGNKTYGILSVFLQCFYEVEYLFTVPPHVFDPPPKVNSAVIRLKRNKVTHLGCDEKLFRLLVKEGFQNRRKTLRNALKRINLPEEIRDLPEMDKRAEQLSVSDFVSLTNKIESK